MSIDRFKRLPLLLGLLAATGALSLPARAAAQNCAAGSAEIRLADRFVITASAGDLSVRALCLTTTTTGAFLFGPDGLQAVVVRMLDRGNGKYWFFSGALTDLPYKLQVVDTMSSAKIEKINPGGFVSFFDSEAFDAEPLEPALPAAAGDENRLAAGVLSGSTANAAEDRSDCAPSLAPDFTFEQAGPRARELKVSFHGSTLKPPDEWRWDFGDAYTDLSAGASVSNTYTAARLYTVTLTVKRYNDLSVESCWVRKSVAVVCGYEAEPDRLAFGAGSGHRLVNVISAPSCTWPTPSNQDFLQFNKFLDNGVEVLKVSVLRNEVHASREATFVVAGQAIKISQPGVPCQYTLDPKEASFPAAGSEETKSPVPVTVTAADCALSATTAQDSPIKLSTDSDGKLFYTMAANTEGKNRSATIQLSGTGFQERFTVKQAACVFTLKPGGSTSLSSSAELKDHHVGSAPPGCQLVPVSSAPFLIVKRDRTDKNQILIRASANPSSLERGGTVTIAGVPFQVHQQGCATISPPRMTFPLAQGESNQVHVTAPPDCKWTVENNARFVTLTQTAGDESPVKKGDATFEVAVAPSAHPHLGALSIAGRVLVVEQGPAPAPGCAGPSALSGSGELFDAPGGVGTLHVAPAGQCSWELKTEASRFLRFGTPDPATNAVPYCVAANRNAFRGGLVAIADQVSPDHPESPAGESPFRVLQLARNGGDPAVLCGGGDPTALCLLGRYEVRVTHGDTRETRAEATVRHRFPNVGSFWFFNPEDIELVVKVEENADGGMGVYFGALTSLPYVVTVTDTQTGRQAFYCNLESLHLSQGDPTALPLQ
jgi:PKD repeat protein